MKEEAIRALELFRQQHLSQPTERPKIDIESLRYPQREVREIQPVEAPTQEPKKQKGVNFNYPDHYKPLKDRIMSALNNGSRTADTIAKYCKEDNVKLVNLQLGRWVSRGMIGRQTNPQSGITRFYPHDEAKEKGILCAPQPINRKKKVKEQKRSSSLYNADGVNTGNSFNTQPTPSKDQNYIIFLEKRVTEWQVECRKLANENEKIKDALAKSLERRNVTSEVTEVMKEVMDLRATVAYLESKLFGGK